MKVDDLEQELTVALRQRVEDQLIQTPSIELLKTSPTRRDPQAWAKADQTGVVGYRRVLMPAAACLVVALTLAGLYLSDGGQQSTGTDVTSVREGPVAVETGLADAPSPRPDPTEPGTAEPRPSKPAAADDDVVLVGPRSDELADAGGGIIVHISIADDVSRLLADAKADGISLGGGGFRDSALQIAERKANCGTSDYAIYEMPASECSTPTARPDLGMHEQGLAIDFTCDGELIRRRSNPCWAWLDANAADYGLIGLPTEAWHWSTTGT